MAGNNVLINVAVNNNTHSGFNAVNAGLQNIRHQVNNTSNSFNHFDASTNHHFNNITHTIDNSGQTIIQNFGAIGQAAQGASGAIGSGGAAGGGLTSALYGLGAVVGLTALPALGALAPMIAGAGLAAVTAKMAFSGVGQAVELAGKDSQKYHDALKKMSPEQREFTKAVVAAKKEFGGLAKEVQKIVLPAFTKALKDAEPLLGVVKDGIKGMAHTLADFGKEFGKLFGSKKFQKDLESNFKMGTDFIGKFAHPLTQLIGSFVEFGAKSKPTLDAFGNGFAKILGQGLPGFFQGLEKGIGGSAKMFNGLFDALATLLPAIGRLSGHFANTFGPLLGSIFRLVGNLASALMDALGPALDQLAPLTGSASDAMDKMNTALTPVIKAIGKGLAEAVRFAIVPLKNFYDFLTIALPVAKDLAVAVGGALFGAFMDMTGAGDKVGTLNNKLTDLANWTHDHRTDIRDGVQQIADAIIDMVTTGIKWTPKLIGAFETMSVGILNALDGIISGLADTFGMIPGIGDKLKSANKKFDEFKNNFISGLEKAKHTAQDFSDKAVPRLEQNKLKLNISNWTRNINDAKNQLKDKNLPPGKRAKLTADIRDWTAKRKNAEEQLRRMKAEKTAKLKGDGTSFFNVLGQVRRAQVAAKTAKIKGDTSGFWSSVHSIAGRVVASAYVNLKAMGGKLADMLGFAHGGIVGQAATGGVRSRLTLVGERGPELVNLAPGSRVHSNDDTRRMLAGGMGGHGGPLMFEVQGGESDFEKFMIAFIRKHVRIKGGGDVQRAFGRA